MILSNLKSEIFAELNCSPLDLEASGYDVKTACQLFEAQAARLPEQTALVYQDLRLSYQALNELSNQLARTIRQQYFAVTQTELKPNTLIPVSLGRSADFVIAILAILKAGGAYVPINPEYPNHRIQHILSDINAKIILTEPALFDKFRGYDASLKAISMHLEQGLAEEKHNLDIPISPNDLAYVIYTSGSSGTPKGVMARHATLISQTVCASYFSADESDTVAFFSDVSFDSTTTEIWGALLSGASLFIPDNFFELLSNPQLFKDTVLQNRLTIILLTRALFDLLFTLDETVFASVNFMMVGGEALTKNIMLRLSQSPHKPALLINAYGPTENSTFCTTYKIEGDFSQYNSVPIGRPYSNRIGLVLDKHLQLLPIGITGELYVGGTSLSKGYLNHPEMTADKFITNPYFEESGENYASIYKTNDLVRWLPEGNLEYIARNDFMVKLRGYRIELGEIETRMLEFSGIKHSVVLMEQNESLSYLVGYYVADKPVNESQLREQLALTLPDYMIPSVFVYLKTLPVTTNGKLDRKALPKASLQLENSKEQLEPRPTAMGLQSIERLISDIWARTLNTSNFNREQSFFNLGGNSLAAMMVRKELEDVFALKINIVELFQYTTLALLAERIAELLKSSGVRLEEDTQQAKANIQMPSPDREPIAIVGMACRLPEVNDPQAFWDLLAQGQTNIRDFDQEKLKDRQVSDDAIANPSYVKRGAVFENPFNFDAGFFGYSVKDAEIMDPQQRQFLECAWEALENSGNIPEKYEGEIGVFATQGRNYYFMDHIYQAAVTDPNLFQAILGNEKDFLSTRVSYKLNLTGPSITLQTACSSSLVSIQMACENLKSGACSMALAGGVSIFYNYGYPYQEDLIESPDGYCRAFDADAKGTVITSGVGIVVLKRLSDAIADKDTIYAIIKGGAINNDGSAKMAFTAPSVKGQSAVIEKALKDASVSPDTITYIESHGTGTRLGDPIEWTALHQVYQKYSNKAEYCTIGSVKTNIGHTDSAAGVFGLMKAALALRHRTLPATLNYQSLNPEIASFNQLFRVSNQTTAWVSEERARRAAVSSFGLGGTNAHVILEEYPEHQTNWLNSASKPTDLGKEGHLFRCYLVPLSAKNRESLYALAGKYKNYLDSNPMVDLENIAYTAQTGRAEFKVRGFFLVSRGWGNQNSPVILTYLQEDDDLDIVQSFVMGMNLLIQLMKDGQALKGLEQFIPQFMGIIDVLFLQLIGLLWVHELPVNWNKILVPGESARKIMIPTYCFTHKHYEIPKIKTTAVIQETVTVVAEDNQSVESRLKTMWSDVLGVSKAELSTSSDFLALGGDSLAFIDLFNFIKKVFSVHFKLEEIIKYNEFGLMCQFISERLVEIEAI